MKKVFLSLFFAALLAVVGAGLYAKRYIDGVAPLQSQRLVMIESGMGLVKISERLADEGVISNPYLFAASSVVLEKYRLFKAGEYEFKSGLTVREIVDMLASGRVFLRKITIPEGITVYDAVKIINSADAMTGSIQQLPPEGSIMPDTYIYNRNQNRQELLNKMQQDMTDFIGKAWSNYNNNLPISDVNQLLTLASIIERETAVESERRTVAAVYINRLRKGMRLEADPTVIYGLTQGKGKLERTLTFADLKYPTEYNTYIIPALPPTPIAIPGKSSIMAALNPDNVDYVFFVASGSGGHNFATTYDEHKKNVTIWRGLGK